MIFKKILNLNFFLIFVILILIIIGTAALYSAGEVFRLGLKNILLDLAFFFF